jgi:hypothetical protein
MEEERPHKFRNRFTTVCSALAQAIVVGQIVVVIGVDVVGELVVVMSGGHIVSLKIWIIVMRQPNEHSVKWR